MSSTAKRDVFHAIADPTRRQILTLLAVGSMNLNALAENFDISRPAVSQQVKVLEECGLVEIRRQGRERFCQAKLEPLSEVELWITENRKYWNDKLNALDAFLATSTKKKHHGKRNRQNH